MKKQNIETSIDVYDVYIPQVDVYIRIGNTDCNEWGQSDPVFIVIPKGKKVLITDEITNTMSKKNNCIVLNCKKGLSIEESYLFDKVED